MKRSLVAITLFALALGSIATESNADVFPRRRSSPRAMRRGKPVVAVLPFTSPTRWGVMGRNAQATFVTQLVKTRRVRVIQASMVLRTLRRHGLHWTGVLNPRMLRGAKRWLRANYVLAGKLRWGGDAYILSMHVMNVNTLETTMAEDMDFRNLSKMRVAVRIAARKIAGAISGTSSGSGGNTALFTNVNPRAFYDTADACIRAMAYAMNRYSFSGTVNEANDSTKVIKLRGYGGNLRPGTPIDIYSGNDDIDGPKRVATAYFIRKTRLGIEAKALMFPDDGIALGAKATNRKHQWVVAVGRVVDEAAANEQLARKFRDALLERMSEGNKFQQIEGRRANSLARRSSRRARFFAYKKLFSRGIEMVVEGKFYGSAGARRADFKIYSTLTGKLWGRFRFETRL